MLLGNVINKFGTLSWDGDQVPPRLEKNVEKMLKFWNFQKCHIFHLKSIQIDILIVSSTRETYRFMFQMLADNKKL